MVEDAPLKTVCFYCYIVANLKASLTCKRPCIVQYFHHIKGYNEKCLFDNYIIILLNQIFMYFDN